MADTPDTPFYVYRNLGPIASRHENAADAIAKLNELRAKQPKHLWTTNAACLCGKPALRPNGVCAECQQIFALSPRAT